jgi:putative oxidoreductase
MLYQLAGLRRKEHNMYPTSQSLIAMVGRVLLSVIFILSGITKVLNWTDSDAMMVAQNIPHAQLLLFLAIIVELVGGLALLVGLRTRLAAVVLFLYLIPVTLIFHHFWGLPPVQQQGQMTQFLKNLAIMGGLLECWALGAGALSVDTTYAPRRFRWPLRWGRRRFF